MAETKRIVVTGGNGLVGKALQEAVRRDSRKDEEWVFLSSRDGDLRLAAGCGNRQRRGQR